MDYHPEGSKAPRSKRLRLFTVSHVCVWRQMGGRRCWREGLIRQPWEAERPPQPQIAAEL